MDSAERRVFQDSAAIQDSVGFQDGLGALDTLGFLVLAGVLAIRETNQELRVRLAIAGFRDAPVIQVLVAHQATAGSPDRLATPASLDRPAILGLAGQVAPEERRAIQGSVASVAILDLVGTRAFRVTPGSAATADFPGLLLQR